ncbi:protein toll-like [Mercenaria mercenaria]|uniref:protein toll-like n=1 Tax=Mercenaria mercenaria TaxID=6596 RepID=UPI00234F28E8|nr:protein toll-like [Mercenaria mercenaria]
MLKTKFPKVQALTLHSVSIDTTLQYPWANFRGNGSGPSNRFDIAKRLFHLDSLDTFPRSVVILDGGIDYVIISNVSAKSLPREFFWNVTGMTRLDLSENLLTDIDADLLRNQVTLEDLHLSKNRLRHLDQKVFQSLYKVGFLDLSFNLLKAIDSELLTSLISLEEIHLDHNLIETLPKDFLQKQMPTIQKVFLQYNNIKTIPVFPFYAKHFLLMNMNHCKLNGNSLFTLIEHVSFLDTVATYIDSESLNPNIHFQQLISTRAILDLSYCHIKDISLKINQNDIFVLESLLKFIEIQGSGNPVDCSCAPLSQQFDWDWKCWNPPELRGRMFKTVTDHEMRCPQNFEKCPQSCTCYIRLSFKSKIIDCRNTNLTTVPDEVPTGHLELLFQNSSITSLTPRKYFKNASVLDFSKNKINTLSPSVVASFPAGMSSLMLNNNHLTSLPENLRRLNVSKMTIGHNPFVCDCHTKWMKEWLLERTSPVTDWNEVKCTYNVSKARQLISVPDYMFVCQELDKSKFSVAQHVIFPSTIIGCLLFVLVTLSLIVYFQRFTIKVLLYMHTGFHPFDRVKGEDLPFVYDVYIIYTEEKRIIAQEKLVDALRDRRCRVADFTRNFIIGLSCMDNMERLILKSSKILFFMSEDVVDNVLIMSGWNIAYQRAVAGQMNSVIIVASTEFRKHCKEESLRKYLKTDVFIKENAKLLLEKVLYLMPKPCGEEHIQLHNTERVVTDIDEKVNYIMCPVDGDNDLYREVHGQLIPYLNEYHQNIEDFESAFVPGTDMRDEMDNMLKKSQHFIFILTPEMIGNEMFEVAMFILSTVISKSKLSGYNYLLLVTTGDFEGLDIPGDLKSYMDMFITCDYSDPGLKHYLLESLTYCKQNDQLDGAGENNSVLETNTRMPLL